MGERRGKTFFRWVNIHGGQRRGRSQITVGGNNSRRARGFARLIRGGWFPSLGLVPGCSMPWSAPGSWHEGRRQFWRGEALEWRVHTRKLQNENGGITPERESRAENGMSPGGVTLRK
jgi:hypothetical protein